MFAIRAASLAFTVVVLAIVYSRGEGVLRGDEGHSLVASQPFPRMRRAVDPVWCGKMSRRIINVSNRLPVTIEGNEIKKSSGGLVTALEGVASGELKWIGWPGNSVQDPDRRRALTDRFTRELGFTPVFLRDSEVAGFYTGFSNSSVWPLLHY